MDVENAGKCKSVLPCLSSEIVPSTIERAIEIFDSRIQNGDVSSPWAVSWEAHDRQHNGARGRVGRGPWVTVLLRKGRGVDMKSIHRQMQA